MNHSIVHKKGGDLRKFGGEDVCDLRGIFQDITQSFKQSAGGSKDKQHIEEQEEKVPIK
jgi:hypothetical protein